VPTFLGTTGGPLYKLGGGPFIFWGDGLRGELQRFFRESAGFSPLDGASRVSSGLDKGLSLVGLEFCGGNF